MRETTAETEARRKVREIMAQPVAQAFNRYKGPRRRARKDARMKRTSFPSFVCGGNRNGRRTAADCNDVYPVAWAESKAAKLNRMAA